MDSSSTRAYNNADQLLSLVDKLGAHNKRNLSFTYSLIGNRTQQVDSATNTTINYGYDQADRLTSYNSGLATYAYNGDGLRMSKTRSGSTEQFVWNIAAGLPLLLQDATAGYIYGPGGILLEQVRSDNTVYYYHQDQLGSVRALSNSSGALVASYSYDAYGQVVTRTGTITNPFGYAGEYTDAESGLIYLRARYYDPETQQFITRDPIYTKTEEPYAYAGGSALNLTDPSGLASSTGQDGVGGLPWEPGDGGQFYNFMIWLFSEKDYDSPQKCLAAKITITQGKNFKEHLQKHGQLLKKATTGRNQQWKWADRDEFIRTLQELVDSGALEYTGQYTFKTLDNVVYRYEWAEQGLTMLLTPEGEFITLLEANTGADLGLRPYREIPFEGEEDLPIEFLP